MKLVHNSDEEKKPLQFFKPYCCYSVLFPWMKISVLSSQHIIQVLRLINMFLSYIYTYVYFGKYCLFKGKLLLDT